MGDNSNKRRRFLAGTVSLPVIMTIQSGSALANESVAVLSIRCAAENASRETPTLTATSTDEWVRVEIHLVTLAVNDTAYASPTGATVFFRNLNSSAYYQYTGDNVEPVLLAGNGVPVPNASGVTESMVTNGTRYALVAVDGSGSTVGFAWEGGTGGQKLTASCWTSFAAA